MATLSLYRRVLGSRFEELPEVLRRFHDSPSEGRARGTFQVARGRGWLRNALASLMRMPEAARDVPVELHVTPEGARERWTRYFPGRPLVSIQWALGDLLMERFGLTLFAAQLLIAGSRMSYEIKRVWFAGIPLPPALAPRVQGYVLADDAGWRVVVRVSLPLLGEILHYEGRVEPL